MKNNLVAGVIACVVVSSFIVQYSSFSSPPMPSFRYFGMLVDEYGWPCRADSDTALVLSVRTNECSQAETDEQLGYGINYVIEAPMDYPNASAYAPYAARPGDPASLAVWVGDVQQPLMSTSALPAIGQPGQAVRVNLNLGTDTDHDGLSDEWETDLIINNSGGLFTNITQVLAGDDFDGDGATNGDEFRAGTAPEWAGDVFAVYDWMAVESNGLALCFYTVQGMTYELFSVPSTLANRELAWQRTAFRTSPGGGNAYTFTAPASERAFFYAYPTNTVKLFRLQIMK